MAALLRVGGHGENPPGDETLGKETGMKMLGGTRSSIQSWCSQDGHTEYHSESIWLLLLLLRL